MIKFLTSKAIVIKLEDVSEINSQITENYKTSAAPAALEIINKTPFQKV